MQSSSISYHVSSLPFLVGSGDAGVEESGGPISSNLLTRI